MDPQQKDSVAFKIMLKEFFSKLKGDDKIDNLNKMEVVTLF